MLQIHFLNSSCSQKTAVPRKKIKAKVSILREQLLEKVVVLKVTLKSAIVHNCSSKKFTILNE